MSISIYTLVLISILNQTTIARHKNIFNSGQSKGIIDPKKGYKLLIALKKRVAFLENINSALLGGLTLLFLSVGFSGVLREVELGAQGLAVISTIATIAKHYFFTKTDGCKGTSITVRDWRKMRAVGPDDSKVYPTIKGRYIEMEHMWDDIEAIVEIGHTTYSRNKITKIKRRKRFGIWWKANPKAFVIFENEQGEIVGYICTLPLDDRDKSPGSAHYKCECEEFDLDEKSISNKNTSMILSQGVCLDSFYRRNPMAIPEFVGWFQKQIASMMPLDDKLIEQAMIYAEPVSNYNNTLLKDLGFLKTNKKSIRGRFFYELKFHEKAEESDEGYEMKRSILRKIEDRKKNEFSNSA